ncbi:hypothetical protein CLV93_10721 [Prolixibacter denitrificans]|uniref:Uncharacterized protein n=1 Tax=Prolixibacter denitrificans TaxID=1541063 RepID=A0A2P8CAB8_9BACT|nr:hypothetical protein CLV93_10721 [Prolixibacter denitrificans]
MYYHNFLGGIHQKLPVYIHICSSEQAKAILYGEYDLQDVTDRGCSLDVAGHYSRSDIFNLTVRKSKQPLINIT